MKSFGLIIGLIFNTIAFADPVTIDKINYVYVLDSEKSFDFSGGSAHECESTLYRTTTQTEDIANRKFALALAAYTSGKKVMINTEGCSSNRMKFGWIRILDQKNYRADMYLDLAIKEYSSNYMAEYGYFGNHIPTIRDRFFKA